MRLAFIAMRAFEPLRDQEQGRFHIEVMPLREFSRGRIYAVIRGVKQLREVQKLRG